MTTMCFMTKKQTKGFPDNGSNAAIISSGPMGSNGTETTLSKSERRAVRLKQARPELVDKVGDTLSLTEAVRVGGYRDANELHEDVETKLQIQRKVARKN
jgi:hypothetical protein